VSPAPFPRVIALDGPAGSGKSTVARGVARGLGLPYVDSGATYRAATLAALRGGVDLTDAEAVDGAVGAATIELSVDPDAPSVRLDGEDVTTEIRGPEVTAAVSTVSAIPAVRARLVELQRRFAVDGAVVEGRDIGTVVCPEAPVKVVQAVAVDLARRDRLDSGRAVSPLQAAPDAVHLDSTALSASEVIARVLELAAAAGFHRVTA
jgi:cytidylate kinase